MDGRGGCGWEEGEAAWEGGGWEGWEGDGGKRGVVEEGEGKGRGLRKKLGRRSNWRRRGSAQVQGLVLHHCTVPLLLVADVLEDLEEHRPQSLLLLTSTRGLLAEVRQAALVERRGNWRTSRGLTVAEVLAGTRRRGSRQQRRQQWSFRWEKEIIGSELDRRRFPLARHLFEQGEVVEEQLSLVEQRTMFGEEQHCSVGEELCR